MWEPSSNHSAKLRDDCQVNSTLPPSFQSGGEPCGTFLNMFFVYVIKSLEHDYIYVGLTNSIERRLRSHNRGYNFSTKPYAPFELIYTKSFPSRPEARIHEKHLKSTSGKRFLRQYHSRNMDLP